MNYKNILIIVIIILWCGVIFYASSRTSSQSNGKSKKIVLYVVTTSAKITNKMHLTKIDLSNDKWANDMVKKLNKPFRKLCHASVYLILSSLIMFGLKTFNVDVKKAMLISIGICFLYSLTDEFHQLFVSGRTGQFSDCLIDTLGATIGAIISRIIILFL